MTIAEAVEIFKNGYHAGVEYDDAACVLADAYLRLTDPTPLTVELIEKELGELCLVTVAERFGWLAIECFRFARRYLPDECSHKQAIDAWPSSAGCRDDERRCVMLSWMLCLILGTSEQG